MLNEATISGARYVARTVPIRYDCRGCVGYRDSRLCNDLPPCLPPRKEDGPALIWINEEPQQ